MNRQPNVSRPGRVVLWMFAALMGAALLAACSGSMSSPTPRFGEDSFDGELARATSPSPSPTVTSFDYTGGSQSFVVPDRVTQLTIAAVGGAGLGGTPAVVVAKIPVTPGETLGIYVGGGGTTGTYPSGTAGAVGGAGGFNGGAAGGAGGNGVCNSGTCGFGGGGGDGGGGASDVRRGGSALANRVIVAAGSGGGGGTSRSEDGANATLTAGGAGGPGAPGDSITGPGSAGTKGISLMGGTGGGGGNGTCMTVDCSDGDNGGSGGGGGYFGGGGGGGGGGAGAYNPGGGGCGSSYTEATATVIELTDCQLLPAGRIARGHDPSPLATTRPLTNAVSGSVVITWTLSINALVFAKAQAAFDAKESTAKGPAGGHKACAWEVNRILSRAGITPLGPYPDSVHFVEGALIGTPGGPPPRGELIPLDQAMAGDIVIEGSSGHIGICASVRCTLAYSNSSTLQAFAWGSEPCLADGVDPVTHKQTGNCAFAKEPPVIFRIIR